MSSTGPSGTTHTTHGGVNSGTGVGEHIRNTVQAVQEMGQGIWESATGGQRTPPAPNTASDFGQAKQGEGLARVHANEHGPAAGAA